MSDGSFEDDSGDDCDDIESGSEDEDTSEIVVTIYGAITSAASAPAFDLLHTTGVPWCNHFS